MKVYNGRYEEKKISLDLDIIDTADYITDNILIITNSSTHNVEFWNIIEDEMKYSIGPSIKSKFIFDSDIIYGISVTFKGTYLIAYNIKENTATNRKISNRQYNVTSLLLSTNKNFLFIAAGAKLLRLDLKNLDVKDLTDPEVNRLIIR